MFATTTTVPQRQAKGAASGSSARISIRWMVFACLLIASVPPVVGLYKWMEQRAIQKEIAYVDENHLIIARNLAAAMERYANDVATVFELAATGLQAGEAQMLRGTLGDFDLRFVALMGPTGSPTASIRATGDDAVPPPAAQQVARLRSLAETGLGRLVFSGIQSFNGSPHFFLVQALPSGHLAIAALRPQYLIGLQQSIQFGERGHSMMVDQNGHVIAHPNADWQASSKDASKLSVVQQMMAGQTGVATFYSPPMQADMISGFTFVPRTGWGVMVPQPMSELIARAKASESAALSLVLVEIAVLILISLWLSRLIATPIAQVVTTAKAVSAGDLNARVPASTQPLQITEAQLLGASFNQVIADLQADRNKLSAALDAAQEGVRAKSRFLAVMSHEVRTPMHGLMGVLELIEQSDLDRDQRHLLGVGQKAAVDMLGLLDSVLDFIKLEADAERCQFTEFKLSDLVQTTVDLFQPLAAQKGLILTAGTSDHLLYGDPQMIGQVLMNLVSNAVKFTSSGQIHIGSDVRRAKDGSEHLSLSVIDTGIGIPKAMQTEIFEEFTQVDAALSRDQGGTGLGLAISSRLAQIMKGKITLRSEQDEGSCFEMTLPIAVVKA